MPNQQKTLGRSLQALDPHDRFECPQPGCTNKELHARDLICSVCDSAIYWLFINNEPRIPVLAQGRPDMPWKALVKFGRETGMKTKTAPSLESPDGRELLRPERSPEGKTKSMQVKIIFATAGVDGWYMVDFQDGTLPEWLPKKSLAVKGRWFADKWEERNRKFHEGQNTDLPATALADTPVKK